MPFDTRAIQDSATDPINDQILNRLASTRRAPNASVPNVILDSPTGTIARRQRELIRWRVPKYGIIDMYINPQSLVIEEKKIIQKQRTKGGYVIQYWGEELPIIRLEGHTGSSGIEGINILRRVFRSEQDAFESVSQLLIDRLSAFSGSSFLAQTNTAAVKSLGQVAKQAIPTILGFGPNPPLLPTLGSLATAVELYHQGWAFRGYFDSFQVTESVSNGVGVFNYNLVFNVLDRRGNRSNFMPWHRQPARTSFGQPISGTYKNSDSSNTPMSFGGEEK